MMHSRRAPPPAASRLLVGLAVALVGCTGAPVSSPDRTPRLPDDWQPDTTTSPPRPPVAPRLTLETGAGPFTIEAVREDGSPVEIGAAVAFDEDADGIEDLYLSDGAVRWRLDPASLALVEPTPWADAAGVVHVPDTLASGWLGGVPVLLATSGAEVRAWDVATGTLGDPVPLVEQGSDADVVPLDFVPGALAVMHLASPTAGTLVALDPEGAMFVETTPLLFAPYLRAPTRCADGATIAADQLVVARVPNGSGLDEALIVVGSDQAWWLGSALRCFDDPVTVLDDDGQPVEPVFGVGVDLDGDGQDTLVWGHR